MGYRETSNVVGSACIATQTGIKHPGSVECQQQQFVVRNFDVIKLIQQVSKS